MTADRTTIQQFAREMSQQLRPYLATGTEPEDIYPVVLGMMQREIQLRVNRTESPYDLSVGKKGSIR